MTIPIGRYAGHGPTIPVDGMPDSPPLRILNINELSERNGLNETVFLVLALSQDATATVIKVMVAVNPFNGEPTRAAVMLRPGAGFVAVGTECLPGNLVDILRTITLDPRPTA